MLTEGRDEGLVSENISNEPEEAGGKRWHGKEHTRS